MNHSVPHSHGNWGICVGKVLIVTRFLLGGDYDNNGHGVCLYVCHKSDYFRIQGIWSFLMFLESFRIQKCLKQENQKIPRKSHYFQGNLLFFLVLDTFPIQGILLFLLFLDTSRIHGILSFLLFRDTFGKG